MTMKEIGATLDLSESRVSQMHSSILARLKAQMQHRSRESRHARIRPDTDREGTAPMVTRWFRSRFAPACLMLGCVIAAQVAPTGRTAHGEPLGRERWVEVDPVSMCAMVARELRDHPVRDLVTVTASTAVEKKTDTFEVFFTRRGDASVRIDIVLGPLRVWADGAEVCAVHTRHAETVFRADVGDSGPIAAIDARLPPIPMPQVWVAASDPKRLCPSMGPYLGEVDWSRAELSPEAAPPRLRMFGATRDTGAAVEFHAIVEPLVRIERITIRDEAESSTIDIRIEPLSDDAQPPAPVALDGRRTVATVAELAQAPPAEAKPE
jgi:hypothetical protein